MIDGVYTSTDVNEGHHWNDVVKGTDKHRKAVTGVASSGPILLLKPDKNN